MLLGGWAMVVGCGPAEPVAADGVEAAAPTAELASSPQWPSWGGVPWPTGDDALAASLRQAELARDPSARALTDAWHHEDPSWRARSAWSLARIGGRAARDVLSARLGDGRIELDAPALAAVALLEAPAADEGTRDAAWDELEQRLWTRYALAEAPAAADALLLAIARVGGARSVDWLAVDLTAEPQASPASREVPALEALGILCARGHALPARALQAVAQRLSDATAPPRRAAAQALARCAGVSAEQLAGAERGVLVERLVPMTRGDDAEQARRAWHALEGLGELPAVVPGWILGHEPSDWIAEVAAVRALAAHADGRVVIARRLADVDVAAFTGPRLHVLHVLLRHLRPFASDDAELEPPVERLARSLHRAVAEAPSSSPLRRRALTLVACEAELLLAIRRGSLDAVSRCPEGSASVPPEHADGLIVEALVHMGSARPKAQRVELLLERAADARPRVAAPALGALARIDDPRVAAALRDGLARGDLGVVAASAGAVAARASDRSRRDPEAVAPLLSVVERFDDERSIEARVAALDALGRMARSEGADEPPAWLERHLVPLATEPAVAVRTAARRALRGHPRLLDAFEARVPAGPLGAFDASVHASVERLAGAVLGLRLRTDAGRITIDFSGAPAPIAQASLAARAQQGFFDGLTIHRVVPGFVIQGGDPRGDGYGGPGHVMPCEWSNLRYERGTVGIALAGKDTGGSQFFIAHDRASHLDARYTVIGRVVEGLDVVDAVWPYDRIVGVDVVTSGPLVPGEATAP